MHASKDPGSQDRRTGGRAAAPRSGDLPAPPGSLETIAPAELLRALRGLRAGDFSVRLPLDRAGVAADIARAFNEAAELHERLVRDVSRVTAAAGQRGQLEERAPIADLGGGWRTLVDCVNEVIANLARPTAEVRRVISAVASGDLSQHIPLEIDGRPLQGEFLAKAKVVNGLVEQLGAFASEVTRVAREVATEGKLGGQAQVPGVAGTWKDLTESVNLMAGNLTSQVRNIAAVTTAVAMGDLSKQITVDVKGEMLELKNTINTMVDQLNAFASEVTRVAREVGTEGKLGGQARVPGVGGTWKDLTESVNSMASNLTSQVRNIAAVTTAVAKGDLSKQDHGRRQGRDPRAQEHDQHDGGPAPRVRVGGDPGRARGRHRGQAGRPGPGARASAGPGRT